MANPDDKQRDAAYRGADPHASADAAAIDIDALELRNIQRRFLALNQDRLARVQDSLQTHQKSFIELLPLLFHINHPMLPGYLSSDAPSGISGYAPGRRALLQAKRMAKSFRYLRRAQRAYAIHALYLMGSSGTIGYSGKSDFDVWVCHRPGLDTGLCETLAKKAEAIQTWAESLGLEVHFFIMDDVSFKKGLRPALSEESSGSSQHHLLLDEFYRTALLLAGRFPVWWLVPPGQEHRYDEYVGKLLLNRFIKAGDVVDFGGLAGIPAQEFFGATLWQLNKAVDSPYKSLMKLMLLEAYARQYPDIQILAMRFKHAVYQNRCALNAIDPYVMMCNAVEEYLFGQNEMQRLDLVRRCFYFKVDIEASKPGHRDDWRYALMRSLVELWGWGQQRLDDLDQRKHWKIRRVLEEQGLLVRELTRSYGELSRFARETPEPAAITQSELQLLGRKLYIAFDQKPGKIDRVNTGIGADLSERNLTLRAAGSTVPNWELYPGSSLDDPQRETTLLKRDRSLLLLLGWCHFNGLINRRPGSVHIQPPDASLSQWELRCLMDCLQELFPAPEAGQSTLHDLGRPARLRQVGAFINIAHDPMQELTRRGMQLISDRSDPLAYGQQRKNLAVRFEMIARTSWDEIVTFDYRGDDALAECLCDYMAWSPIGAGRPVPLPCFSFSTSRGPLIARRFEALTQDVVNFFYSHKRNANGRYVLAVGTGYYALQVEDDVPRYTRLDSLADLYTHLGSPQDTFSPMRFDPVAFGGSALELIGQHNRQGLIQVVYEIRDGRAMIHLLDEQGSLLFEEREFHDQTSLLGSYRRFFANLNRRLGTAGAAARTEFLPRKVAYYQITQGADSEGRLHPLQDPVQENTESAFDVLVSYDGFAGPADSLVVTCRGTRFAARELGEDLYHAVAAFVLNHRPSGQTYPIYITDLDIHGDAAPGIGGLQTAELIRIKHRFEQRLNRAWQSLLAGHPAG